MERIGSIDLARQIGEKHWERAPKGFTRLGTGAYRVALLHRETGIVYKHGSLRTQWAEEVIAAHLRERTSTAPVPVYIPRTRLFTSTRDQHDNVVSAQELADGVKPYCRAMDSRWVVDPGKSYFGTGRWERGTCSCGTRLCHMTALDNLAAWSNLGDLHYMNAKWNKATGVYTILDMGEAWTADDIVAKQAAGVANA